MARAGGPDDFDCCKRGPAVARVRIDWRGQDTYEQLCTADLERLETVPDPIHTTRWEVRERVIDGRWVSVGEPMRTLEATPAAVARVASWRPSCPPPPISGGCPTPAVP